MAKNALRQIRRHAKNARPKLDGRLTVHAFPKSCGQNWADHLPMKVVKEFMAHEHQHDGGALQRRQPVAC